MAAEFFYNSSQIIGQVITQTSQNLTGSLFITLLFLIFVIMAIALIFGIALEYTFIIVLPLVLSCMAFYGDFFATGSVMLIYLAIILTKNFIMR